MQQAPFLIRNIDVNGAENYTGYCIDLLEEISDMLNFDYDIYLGPDNNFGVSDDNGHWNGIIKELIEKVKCYHSISKFFLTIFLNDWMKILIRQDNELIHQTIVILLFY